MYTSKIRVEKAATLPKAKECEDFYILNTSTRHLHYKEKGAVRWSRINSVGTAVAAPRSEVGDWYAGKELIYICLEKGAACVFSKEEWVSNGLPLPEPPQGFPYHIHPVPLETLTLNNNGDEPSVNNEGHLENIVFNGTSGILSYRRRSGLGWTHITCFPAVEMRDLSIKPGEYVIMDEIVYIRGQSKLFYLELSEFREVIEKMGDGLFIPDCMFVSGWSAELTRNSVTLTPSKVHVYDKKTGMPYLVQNVLFIVRPNYFDNEVLITTEGAIAIPKGFKVNKSFENTQAERLLKGVPGAFMGGEVREQPKHESILSEDFMRPLPIIVKSEDKNGGEVPENVLARIETLEKHVEKILTHIKGVM